MTDRDTLTDSLRALLGPHFAAWSPRATLHPPGPPAVVGHPVPNVVRGYVRNERLTHGSSFILDIAYDVALGREVVLKRLARPGDPVAAKRLLREARVAGKLQHASVVPIHAVLPDTEIGPVVVMTHVRGNTWSDAITQRQRSIQEHIEIALHVARALLHARVHRYLHADLKPSNVLLGGYGEVCVIGWGEALDLDDEPPGHPMGTPAYAPPELLSGRPHPTSDVYLLAACLWEALCGVPPHLRDDVLSSTMAAWEPPRAGPDVPAGLQHLLLRSLDPDPERRPASVRLFVEELERYLHTLDTRAVLDEVRDTLQRDPDRKALAEAEQRLEGLLALNPDDQVATRMMEDLRALQQERREEADTSEPLPLHGAVAPPPVTWALWGAIFFANLLLIAIGPSPDPHQMLVLAGGSTCLVAGFTFWHGIHRTHPVLVALVVGVLASWTVNRAIGLWDGHTPDAMRTTELTVLGAASLAAASVHRPFGYLGLAGFACAAVAAVFPGASRVLLVVLAHLVPFVASTRPPFADDGLSDGGGDGDGASAHP